MIPKIIHYCWFGSGKMPKLAKKCIKSWKRYCPDYEIKEWNENNFDVNIIPYVQEAYRVKKYAFVSDYARFWILYHYGGLYFDTDVEMVKPIDGIISRGSFMGCENEVRDAHNAQYNDKEILYVNPGLGLGCCSNLTLFREILDYYQNIHFINEDGTLNQHTVVEYTTNILNRYGLKKTNGIQECAGITIYPKDFFCPLSWDDEPSKFTENTVTIHHFAGSWLPLKNRLRIKHPYFAEKYPSIFHYCFFLPMYIRENYMEIIKRRIVKYMKK